MRSVGDLEPSTIVCFSFDVEYYQQQQKLTWHQSSRNSNIIICESKIHPTWGSLTKRLHTIQVRFKIIIRLCSSYEFHLWKPESFLYGHCVRGLGIAWALLLAFFLLSTLCQDIAERCLSLIIYGFWYSCTQYCPATVSLFLAPDDVWVRFWHFSQLTESFQLILKTKFATYKLAITKN